LPGGYGITGSSGSLSLRRGDQVACSASQSTRYSSGCSSGMRSRTGATDALASQLLAPTD